HVVEREPLLAELLRGRELRVDREAPDVHRGKHSGHMRRSLAPLLAAALAATALAAGAARPAGGAYPGGNRLVAFPSVRDRLGPAIFTMHTDGTGLVRLTSPPPSAAAPAFSPDGHTLAFDRITDESRSEVWLARANGTDLRPLLRDGDAESSSPAW